LLQWRLCWGCLPRSLLHCHLLGHLRRLLLLLLLLWLLLLLLRGLGCEVRLVVQQGVAQQLLRCRLLALVQGRAAHHLEVA
jgi:hypothetical protein